MLDFICELERVLGKWPQDVSWSIAQIADYTNSSVPQVVDILSDTLDRELEVHESLTYTDASNALGILKDRMSVQLAARQRRIEERREKAIRAYDVTMERVRALLLAKNGRNAYKTLSYFVGRYEHDLPEDLLLTLCGECLRLGAKADANLQELSQWLRKGVQACVKLATQEATLDGLDFIDAYRDLFLDTAADGGDERGRRLLNNVMETLRESAASYELTLQFDSLVQEMRAS